MITQEIQNYVDRAIKSAQKNVLYDVSNTVYHEHNGTDSPHISYKNILDTPVISQSNYVTFGSGAPTGSAPKGTLYINIIATTSTTRLYINTDGSTTWAYFTASA